MTIPHIIAAIIWVILICGFIITDLNASLYFFLGSATCWLFIKLLDRQWPRWFYLNSFFPRPFPLFLLLTIFLITILLVILSFLAGRYQALSHPSIILNYRSEIYPSDSNKFDIRSFTLSEQIEVDPNYLDIDKITDKNYVLTRGFYEGIQDSGFHLDTTTVSLEKSIIKAKNIGLLVREIHWQPLQARDGHVDIIMPDGKRLHGPLCQGITCPPKNIIIKDLPAGAYLGARYAKSEVTSYLGNETIRLTLDDWDKGITFAYLPGILRFFNSAIAVFYYIGSVIEILFLLIVVFLLCLFLIIINKRCKKFSKVLNYIIKSIKQFSS